jgi:hypothetical protein
MFKLKDKIDSFAALNPKKKITLLALFTVFALIPIIDTHLTHGRIVGVIWILDGIMIGLMLFAIMIIAAFSIMESLVETAAGLSLLIFLGQAYCASPGRALAGDRALQALMGVGLIYLSFHFFKALYKSVKKNSEKIEKKKWNWEKVALVVFFAFFACIMLWDLYLVLHLIITGICIYK